MPAPFGSSPKRAELNVRDPHAARLLLDPKALRALSPFVPSERTAASVASELAMPLNTLLYQLKTLLGTGLLEVSRTERRAGKAIKHYRAVAERFVVPYGLTPAADPEALLALEHAEWERRLVRGLAAAGRDAFDTQGKPMFGLWVVLEGGRLVHKNAAGPDTEYTLLQPEAPAIVDYWLSDIELNFSEAKALQRELCALINRYRGRRGGGRHLLRVAMTPLVGD